MDEPGMIVGVDRKARCSWCAAHDDMIAYHDAEWGFPVMDDRRLFEKLCLEGFQSGLSWLTILRKREAFRRAFADFDVEKVARFGSRHVERMLKDASIVRHRGKIESVIGNARRALLLADEFGSIAAYAWRYESDPARGPRSGPDFARSGRHVQGPQEASMDVRRSDHDLCLHAGDGARERPRARLLGASRCGGREADDAKAVRPSTRREQPPNLRGAKGPHRAGRELADAHPPISTRTSFSTFAPSASTIRRT